MYSYKILKGQNIQPSISEYEITRLDLLIFMIKVRYFS